MSIVPYTVEPTEASLKTWLAERVAEYVRLTPDQIRSDTPLADYGLDSVYALTLNADIEDYLGLTLDNALMWDHPTIDALSKVLIEMMALEKA
ncbi:acyl carrier protein [Massilia scottii]|uniref:acyl carrier protein n=1 Tax=Massilia scottii TaxID=3057166 RepID=UPI002796D853|nr:acyl carrier protein [Massilia sp. CCM 9029]MDQ1829198.1 acyl carrier protein [Massilia sp. CCM 9029]